MKEPEVPRPDECDEDENTVAKSLIDEIIEETESLPLPEPANG